MSATFRTRPLSTSACFRPIRTKGLRAAQEIRARWSFDTNGDVDLRRATRLTVRDGDFRYLGVREIED